MYKTKVASWFETNSKVVFKLYKCPCSGPLKWDMAKTTGKGSDNSSDKQSSHNSDTSGMNLKMISNFVISCGVEVAEMVSVHGIACSQS